MINLMFKSFLIFRIKKNLKINNWTNKDNVKSGYKIRISGYQDHISGYHISGYQDIRISGYQNIRILGYQDIRISNIRY